jgi:hypothetical protein
MTPEEKADLVRRYADELKLAAEVLTRLSQQYPHEGIT